MPLLVNSVFTPQCTGVHRQVIQVIIEGKQDVGQQMKTMAHWIRAAILNTRDKKCYKKGV